LLSTFVDFFKNSSVLKHRLATQSPGGGRGQGLTDSSLAKFSSAAWLRPWIHLSFQSYHSDLAFPLALTFISWS
jgi:hypothetical protein